jgi:hypothetical protein
MAMTELRRLNPLARPVQGACSRHQEVPSPSAPLGNPVRVALEAGCSRSSARPPAGPDQLHLRSAVGHAALPRSGRSVARVPTSASQAASPSQSSPPFQEDSLITPTRAVALPAPPPALWRQIGSTFAERDNPGGRIQLGRTFPSDGVEARENRAPRRWWLAVKLTVSGRVGKTKAEDVDREVGWDDLPGPDQFLSSSGIPGGARRSPNVPHRHGRRRSIKEAAPSVRSRVRGFPRVRP